MSGNGRGMKDKNLKIADIASITGLSEEEVRNYATDYQTILPSRKLGRIRLYDAKAAQIISDIADSVSKGMDKEAIQAKFGKNKPRKRIGGENGETRQKFASKEEPPTFTPPEREIAQKSPAVEERIALQERQIKRLRDMIRTREQINETALRDLEERIAHIHHMLENQQRQIDNISEWVGYFDGMLDAQRSHLERQASITLDWIEYIEKEIDLLKRPFSKKVTDSLKKP
jgi:DNA-binding transcriptional MerR regulator